MRPETKLYAQYTDHNYGRGAVEEVTDLNDAVQKGLDKGSPRFQTFEITSVEIDREILEGQAKNHSANIYVGVNQIVALDDVIKHHEHEIETMMSAPRWVNAQFTAHFQMTALQGVVTNLKAKDASTKFIGEGGQRGDFIELKDGEMVFDSNGQQLHPNRETPNLAPDPVWNDLLI